MSSFQPCRVWYETISWLEWWQRISVLIRGIASFQGLRNKQNLKIVVLCEGHGSDESSSRHEPAEVRLWGCPFVPGTNWRSVSWAGLPQGTLPKVQWCSGGRTCQQQIYTSPSAGEKIPFFVLNYLIIGPNFYFWICILKRIFFLKNKFLLSFCCYCRQIKLSSCTRLCWLGTPQWWSVQLEVGNQWWSTHWPRLKPSQLPANKNINHSQYWLLIFFVHFEC